MTAALIDGSAVAKRLKDDVRIAPRSLADRRRSTIAVPGHTTAAPATLPARPL